MIERITVTGEKTSDYFIHNDKLARSWENLAQKFEGNITGRVNSRILEFELTFTWRKKEINISGLRQISDKNAGHSTGLLMTKNTRIQIHPHLHKNRNWIIYKKNFFTELFYSLTGKCKTLEFNNEYSIASGQRITDREIISPKDFKMLWAIAELKKIKQKDAALTIEYYNLLGTESVIQLLREMVE